MITFYKKECATTHLYKTRQDSKNTSLSLATASQMPLLATSTYEIRKEDVEKRYQFFHSVDREIVRRDLEAGGALKRLSEREYTLDKQEQELLLSEAEIDDLEKKLGEREIRQRDRENQISKNGDNFNINTHFMGYDDDGYN